MMRLIIAVLGLSLGLGGLSGAVGAQAQGPVVYDDASGADGTCTTTRSPRDQMIVCTTLDPGRGVALIEPGAERAPVSEEVPPTSAPAPEPESAPTTTEAAVASATD